MAKRGSEWAALRRGLLIVQRLLQADATTEEIIAHVRKVEGEDAYPELRSARMRAFARDKDSLRHRLDVLIHYNTKNKKYRLLDPGPFFSLRLSAQGKRALALISQTFTGQAGEHSEIDSLVRELIRRVPEDERRWLEDSSRPINLEILQDVDPNGIPARVWQTVQRAVRENRKLVFNHLSPRSEDRQPRRFEVAAHKIIYEWGHWYLRGYSLLRPAHVQAAVPEPPYLRFRLAYIQNDDDLNVLPSKLPPIAHHPPRILVHYRLLPRLARGVVSRHFEEMTTLPLEDGSVEVRGITDDAWKAARLLLGYGQYCIVLGGDEVRRYVEAAIEGMYRNAHPDF